ncbi:MAG TPA: Ig-like domain-containing protein [Burkholderiaceae bacterium]|nr:Ig-like domain-containing protein [Burkholderiaceae bacterium]
MFESIRNLRWRRMLLGAAALAAAVQLAGCGGSGAGAGGAAAGTDAGSSDASSIQVLKSVPTVPSDGRTKVTLTAVVKNGGNVGLKGQTVSYSTTDTGTLIEIVSSKTDGAGAATANISISDPRNRVIPITVSAGGVQITDSIAVVGSTVNVVGPGTLGFGSSAEYLVTVRDSGGNPITGKAVAVTSSRGNSINAGSGVTDAQGQLRLTVTGTQAGTDTLSVTAVGASASAAVTVSGTQLSFVTTPSDVLVNTPQALTVRFLQNGVPQQGAQLTLTATRGNLSTQTVTLNSAGEATFTITSTTAGQTDVTASAGSTVTATTRFDFVSTTPDKVKLQPSPAIIGTNLGGSSSSSSQLIAVVRDAADNPVKGKRVNFSQVADPSNGRIEPGYAITDSSGTATAAFIAGPNPTGNGAVQIRATVDGTAIVDTAALTVSKRELYVRIGTGNEIEKVDLTKNSVPFTALVTDSSGNPVADVTVMASLLPLRYAKGTWNWGGTSWQQIVNAVCDSEDTNQNSQLDPGEDVNLDQMLTPGHVAVVEVTSANAKTSASGFAEMKITYPRWFSRWAEVRLEVTATVVAGTEGATETDFWLPMLASDLSSETVAPPGLPSPFGIASVCTDKN